MWTLLIISVGVSFFLRGAASLLAGESGRTYVREGYETQLYTFWNESITITDYQVVIIVTTVGVLLALALFLKFSKLGKAIRAVSDNAQLAAVVGIDVKK